jgi:two-component system, OmpR family, response regulator
MQILVVEDDVQLARLVSSALIEAGHDPILVHDGEQGLNRAKDARFDLILLDVMLPGMDGFDVLRHLRERHIASRVLMLTVRGELKDRLTGLELGADDHLAKPFVMRELLVRVNALGRRYSEEPKLNLRVDDLTLDVVNHQVHRGSRPVELSGRELMLLKVLMREPGRVFTRTELCERIWEHAHEYESKLVEVYILRLRERMGEPQLIHTVRHVGYTICESSQIPAYSSNDSRSPTALE